jgi:drug/metabolite transporter (DMT)-like permease
MILFADERRLLRKPRFYIGLALSVIGFLALTLTAGKTVTTTSATGLTIMFFCSLCFGSYMLSVRKFIPTVDPILAFAIVAQLCSLVLAINMFAIGDYSKLANLGTREWMLIFASSVLGIGVGHVLLYVALVRLGASVTTSCQSVMPFLTAAIASVMLGESLTGAQWLSGVIIVTGALILLTVKYRT